ncbi:hypothetical protein PHSC3_000756 [Chlamydiales bacterium STE3]|nr:hypothetical protein PHSC3_000756 [Chlamydiales bacterium STE3]
MSSFEVLKTFGVVMGMAVFAVVQPILGIRAAVHALFFTYHYHRSKEEQGKKIYCTGSESS